MAIRFYLVYIRVQLVEFLAIKLIKDSPGTRMHVANERLRVHVSYFSPFISFIVAQGLLFTRIKRM